VRLWVKSELGFFRYSRAVYATLQRYRHWWKLSFLQRFYVAFR